MISASDLRIGNWYLCYNPMAGVSVAERFENWVHYLDFEGYGVEGVPLTGEILDNAGFKLDHSTYEFMDGHNDGKLFINCSYDGSGLSVDLGNGGKNIFIQLKYVHQLQNLYFTLTGEELKIEL